MKLKDIAEILGCLLEGEGETEITGVASLETARKGDLVYISGSKHRPALDASFASAAVIPEGERYERIPVIRAAHPHLAFIRAVELFHETPRPQPGIHPLACVAGDARIGRDVSIEPLAYVGAGASIGDRTIVRALATIYPGAEIGDDCVIHSHVSVREGCIVGDRVVLHNGVVVGADGFGYIRLEDGTHRKIPQMGRVVIEDDVEIGANTTIDRAALDETRVRRGAKIDNLVQVAHNVDIGENAILVAQVGVAGSSSVGRNAILSGQVGIADHVRIGDNAIVAAKSGITKDVPDGAFVAGIPHQDIRVWRKMWVLLPQIPDIVKDLKQLKARLEAIEKG
ncbi:MAG: UDP-3-O-(3-hydroxymyristoyl)glucosamine N-acyltransferase [Acidobacteriota bacterium]|nr:UDP-3-O-(3-hydroxymyristoyl)glucosamine N-acyltransferase [Acidobacteriota bacterium]